MRARVSLLGALLLLAACRHVPPDKEARAVVRAEPVRRTPSGDELRGLWVSRRIRGTLADLGTLAVYVFGPEGRYSGVVASSTESTPLEGTYSYADGILSFDDGAFEMRATLAGEHLELTSEAAYVELAREVTPRDAGR